MKLLEPKYDSYRYRLFQKTGCLLTADGADDNLVQPEGLPNYAVPPPSIMDLCTDIPVSMESRGPADEEMLVDDIEDDGQEENMVIVDPSEEDDRNIFDIFVL